MAELNSEDKSTDGTPRCPNCNQSNITPYYKPHYLCDNPNCRVRAFEPVTQPNTETDAEEVENL